MLLMLGVTCPAILDSICVRSTQKYTLYAVSVLLVLDMVPVLTVLAPGVITRPCRFGVIRAVFGAGGPCRVQISACACLCRVLHRLDTYIYIYIHICMHIYIYIYLCVCGRIAFLFAESLFKHEHPQQPSIICLISCFHA